MSVSSTLELRDVVDLAPRLRLVVVSVPSYIPGADLCCVLQVWVL